MPLTRQVAEWRASGRTALPAQGSRWPVLSCSGRRGLPASADSGDFGPDASRTALGAFARAGRPRRVQRALAFLRPSPHHAENAWPAPLASRLPAGSARSRTTYGTSDDGPARDDFLRHFARNLLVEGKPAARQIDGPSAGGRPRVHSRFELRGVSAPQMAACKRTRSRLASLGRRSRNECASCEASRGDARAERGRLPVFQPTARRSDTPHRNRHGAVRPASEPRKTGRLMGRGATWRR